MSAGLALLFALTATPGGEALARPPSFPVTWLGTPPARPAGRIVSLAPSLTELVFALGAGDRVVGVSSYDDFPPEVSRLPRVGGFTDPNLEAILSLRPDLVLAAPNAANRRPLERLAALGTPVLVLPGNRLADVAIGARALGGPLGRAADADGLAARLASDLEALPRLARIRAVFVIGLEPLLLAGAGSLPDEALAILGVENVCPVAAEYPSVSLEAVVTARPDVLVFAAMTPSPVEPPGLQRLRALLPSTRVVSSADPALLRAGPRFPAAVRRLAEAIAQGARSSSK